MTVDTSRQTGQPHDLRYERVFGGCTSAPELIEYLKLVQAGAVMSEFIMIIQSEKREIEVKLEIRTDLL